MSDQKICPIIVSCFAIGLESFLQPLSYGSLTLWTMWRCLLRARVEVKHSPQRWHWGVLSSTLCWGMCCSNSWQSAVTKSHFAQRKHDLSCFAAGDSASPLSSPLFLFDPKTCDAFPFLEEGIRVKSGSLTPCMRLIWFFSITVDVNIVASVQYQQT